MPNKPSPNLFFDDDDWNQDAAIPPLALERTRGDDDDFYSGGGLLFLGVLMGFLVFVATLLVVVVIPKLVVYIQRRTRNDEKMMQKRRKKVQQWIISKTIPTQQSSSSKNNEGSASDIETGTTDEQHADDNDTEHECMICMEPFTAGESVAWSIHCDHVFHTECLTKWLLKHPNCPYCRKQVMPDVGSVSKRPPSRKDMKRMQDDRRRRSAETKYTLDEGFVVLSETEQTKNEKSNDFVQGLVVQDADDDMSFQASTDRSSEGDDDDDDESIHTV